MVKISDYRCGDKSPSKHMSILQIRSVKTKAALQSHMFSRDMMSYKFVISFCGTVSLTTSLSNLVWDTYLSHIPFSRVKS